MTTGVVNNAFTINDMLQIGSIEAPTNGETGPVQFTQTPSPDHSKWFYNSNSQIELDNGSSHCLANSNGTLVVQSCGEEGKKPDSSTVWTYNPSKNANKWCLTSTVANATPTCMILGTPSKGKAPVTVGNNSKVGDGWALGFQTIN